MLDLELKNQLTASEIALLFSGVLISPPPGKKKQKK
jgi:hypothetical protein